MNTWRTLLCVCLLAGILAACSGQSASPTSEHAGGNQSMRRITVTASDTSFALPPTIQAGLVEATVINMGAQEHQAQFARLNPGVTFQHLQTTLTRGLAAALPLIMPLGGTMSVQPGQHQTVILNFARDGQYLVFGFPAGQETLSHRQQVITQSFTVIGSSNADRVNLPRADVQVTMRDFSFDLPNTLRSGQLTYQMTNQGVQPHELIFLKLNSGKTWRNVMAFLQAPQSTPLPGKVIGGMSALGPGQTAWINLSLVPGTYVTLCFLPDPASGLLHVQLGMICSFTVK